MKKLVVLILVLLAGQVSAQLIFRSHFGPLDIEPLFPENNGVFTLPDEPAANRLQWFMTQLSANETSLTEINDNFSANYLTQFTDVEFQGFIQGYREQFPQAKITDLVALSAMEAFVFIEGSNGNTAFIRIQAQYTNNQGINFLQIQPRDNVVQLPEDNNLTLAQAISKYTTMAADTSLLVAYINDDDQCQAIDSHNPNELRATASIFKTWVLGGLAEAIDQGTLTSNQEIEFVESERVFNTTLVNLEPFGTMFKLLDLASMMMGNSDNTATDLIHETVGRSEIGDYIDVSGVDDADVLKPLLSLNELFHLFFTFDLTTAENYFDLNETDQLIFINNQIVPLGPYTTFVNANDSLLTAGGWQASPMDICANMANLRLFDKGSAAMGLINRAFGAQASQFRVRPNWDRVWFKSGSFSSGTTGTHVLNRAWLLENNGQWPIVVIAMANDPNGGITDGDGFVAIRSVLARILELAEQGL